MTAHILNPKIDPEVPGDALAEDHPRRPAQELRYSRIVVTDDMEMKAITDHFGADDAPRLALEAGCDLLIYRSEAAARHAYEALSRRRSRSGALAPETVFCRRPSAFERLRRRSSMPYKLPQ